MVFSSRPFYLDPPNWQYQQQHQQQLILHGGGNEISGANNTLQHPLLQQPPVATGGSRNIRPGSMTDGARMAKVPLSEPALKCHRCESTNTKFCYFNNYSLTQPRHFCKICRRYWTRGGALRNVPVGGGCRRATKKCSKKRSKSQAVSETVTITTTANSADQALGDQNGINMIDGVQFPFYFQGDMNQMRHEFGDDHYTGGGNNYGGAQADPHIAKLLQTGVLSLANSSMDQQWSRLAETALTQMHSPPFPYLTDFAQQERYASQPSGLLHQFDHWGGHQGLTGSSLDSLGNISNSNDVNMSIIDLTVATRFTNVKMEGGNKELRRSLGMQAQDGKSQFSMIGNRIEHTWTDFQGFTSSAPTTGP